MILGGFQGSSGCPLGLCGFSSVVVLRKVFWSWFLRVSGFAFLYSGVCFGKIFARCASVWPCVAFSSFVTKFSHVMCVCLIFCGRRVTFLCCFSWFASVC